MPAKASRSLEDGSNRNDEWPEFTEEREEKGFAGFDFRARLPKWLTAALKMVLLEPDLAAEQHRLPHFVGFEVETGSVRS
jgi:hypothetical protein